MSRTKKERQKTSGAPSYVTSIDRKSVTPPSLPRRSSLFCCRREEKGKIDRQSLPDCKVVGAVFKPANLALRKRRDLKWRIIMIELLFFFCSLSFFVLLLLLQESPTTPHWKPRRPSDRTEEESNTARTAANQKTRSSLASKLASPIQTDAEPFLSRNVRVVFVAHRTQDLARETRESMGKYSSERALLAS